MNKRPRPKSDRNAVSDDRNDQRGDADDDAAIGAAFWKSLVVIVLLVSAVGGIAWLWNQRKEPVTTAKSELVQPKARDTSLIQVPQMKFSDVTQDQGLTFKHYNGAKGEKLLPETMGGGCAFWDYDHDGDQDILMMNSCDWPWTNDPVTPPPTLGLFRNDGKGHFTDATAEAGLNVTLYAMGMAIGDYDNDGWCDLFVSSVGRDRLFHNDHGKFRDVTDETGVGGAEDEWGTSCCWFDMDNDGDLDLFVGNYVQWSREKDLSLGSTLDGTQRAYGPPFAFSGTFPYLYRNEGGKFVDVTADSGLQVRNPNTKVPVAKTMGVIPFDADDDGLLDLVIANDTVQNFLFHNRGQGKFDEIAADAGVAYDAQGKSRGAMGIDVGRHRNDRCWTIAIGNFSNEMTGFYVSPKSPLHFFDASVATGLGPATRLSLTFGVLFVDCDLDGRLDLLTANGHLEEEIHKIQETQFYAQPPKLFWNCGADSKPELLPVTAEQCGEALGERMVGRGCAFADIDGDGDLDLLIAGSGSAPRLLRNDQQLGHHWLRVKLVGKSCNRDAIGATMVAHVNGKTIPRYVNPCHSYLSHSELPITFGLGKNDRVDKLVIRWPSGDTQTVENPEIDRTLLVEQAASTPPVSAGPTP
ncbi:MAG: hypothetical protein RIS70_1959 [Planctomycetota bacterium]